MRPIERIIIHCSASPNGRDDTIDDIDRWHKERGFSMVGYHYVIHRDGSRHVGRPEDMVGAHAQYYNMDSIGCCLIGTDSFTAAQWVALMELVLELRDKYPSAKVLGHCDLPDVRKACPGFSVSQWVAGKYAVLFDHLSVT